MAHLDMNSVTVNSIIDILYEKMSLVMLPVKNAPTSVVKSVRPIFETVVSIKITNIYQNTSSKIRVQF